MPEVLDNPIADEPAPEYKSYDRWDEGGPRLPDEKPGGRLLKALGISVLVNIVIFANLSTIVKSSFIRQFLPPAVVTLVKLPPKPKPKLDEHKEKPKKEAAKHAAPQLKRHVIDNTYHPPVMTAVGNGAGGNDNGPSIVSGTGAAPKATPIPTPTPQPVATPTPAPTPQPTIAPTPEPTPEATPTPGVTAGAQPVVKPYPDIPDELKSDDYSSYVRVLVSISAAGDTKKVTLVTSSGNVDIDQRVISAMMQWKWKPALENGKPVDSVEHYRFNFEVN